MNSRWLGRSTMSSIWRNQVLSHLQLTFCNERTDGHTDRWMDEWDSGDDAKNQRLKQDLFQLDHSIPLRS